ncbi:MAG: hypothetical protein P1Q69_08325 [Candidatus Thorarchaeota archaeon]|nr:hypothetical protein [Candidatus Thorarchaeota archaeon]
MNSFDSGKTVLSQKLAENLLETGQSVEYFKPLSGHNYWYRYEHTQRCIADSILASWDAHQVRQVINSKVPLEIANPVHSLYVPSVLNQPSDSIRSSLAIGGWDSVLVMQRFSRPSEKGTNSVSLLARNLIDAERLMITSQEVEDLTSGTKVFPLENGREFETYSDTHLEQVLSESLDSIERSTDVTIIEGFNDSAWPWEGLDRVDSVIVTGPGHLFTYDPERFKKAAFLVKYGSQPIREVSFSRVTEMIKPDEVVHLRPHQGISSDLMSSLGPLGKE